MKLEPDWYIGGVTISDINDILVFVFETYDKHKLKSKEEAGETSSTMFWVLILESLSNRNKLCNIKICSFPVATYKLLQIQQPADSSRV